MLIGIDASRANRPQKTGTEWYSYHLIQELKKIDTENHYFLYTNKPLTGELGQLPSEKWQEKLLKWPLIRLWTQFRLSWEMLQQPPDVLFVPAHALPLVHPKKSVVTIHDIGFERFPKLYQKADIWYHKWVVRYALRHAAKIITVSEFSKKEMVDYYNADPNKIFIIHLGYDREKYKVIDDKEKIRKVVNKYVGNSKYILYVGRLEEKKNIEKLLYAFNALRSYHKEVEIDFLKLLLVGKPGYGFNSIKTAIRELTLWGEVIIPGWVSEEDLPSLFNGAELFVFPSLYEGFGMPLLQAMACGCPIVASRTASIPEIADSAALLVNDPHKSKEISDAIQKTITQPEIKKKLIKMGLERVKQFSWQKCAEKTLKILNLLFLSFYVIFK